MSSIFKKAVSFAAPIVGSVIAPGIGTAIGGALGGAAGGGGLKGALIGGATGALGGGLGSSIAGGLGATGLARQAFGQAIAGGVGGLAGGGGLKGALTGAALGGLGSAVTSGLKVPGLGNVAGSSLEQVSGVAGAQGPTQGSGVLGRLTGLTNTAASGGAQPMRLGSLLSGAGDIYGYIQGKNDLEDIQRTLAQQSLRAQRQLQPYSQSGRQALENLQAPDIEALANDPAYQFRLQQGNQALERSLAARGLGQSGAALKAAQEYGQGLAGQTYDNYFNRQYALANQGLGAASGLGSLYTNLGNTMAEAELARINQRNNMLSGLGGLFR